MGNWAVEISLGSRGKRKEEAERREQEPVLSCPLRPRPGKKGPRNGVGPNGQNVGKKSPDWEIRASRPLPITNIRTATAGFPAAFLGPELDSGKQGFERGGRHTYAWR